MTFSTIACAVLQNHLDHRTPSLKENPKPEKKWSPVIQLLTSTHHTNLEIPCSSLCWTAVIHLPAYLPFTPKGSSLLQPEGRGFIQELCGVLFHSRLINEEQQRGLTVAVAAASTHPRTQRMMCLSHPVQEYHQEQTWALEQGHSTFHNKAKMWALHGDTGSTEITHCTRY